MPSESDSGSHGVAPRPAAEKARERRSAARRPLVGAAVVFAAAVALYANALGGQFVWDDTYVVRDNPAIRDLSNVPSFFTRPWGAGTTDARGRAKNVGYFRPLPLVTYAVDHAVWGLDPFGFRLTNVVLHGLLALLVWSLARRLSGRLDVALVAGLLYAAHTTHTEAVAVVAYRTSLMAVGFVLLGLRLHLGARASASDSRRWLWVPLAFAGGLLSKETAITLPALLFVLDATGAGRAADTAAPSPRALLASYAPLALLVLGYFALRAVLLDPVPVSYFEGVPATGVALTMAKVFALYVRLLIAPWPLTPFYDWSLVPPATSLLDGEVLAGLVAVALTLGAVVWTWRARRRGAGWRAACFLLVAYGVALLPYAHIVPFVVVAADRFLLLPSASFAIGVSWGALALAARPDATRGLWWGLVGLLVFGNAALTIRRNTHWRDNETILRQTAADHPGSFNARMRLGELLEAAGELDAAEAEYRAAHRIFPQLPAPLERLAAVLAATGRADEARAVEVDLERLRRAGP